jgi:predicted  nucleic acid-binding Zn-ribbon protein
MNLAFKLFRLQHVDSELDEVRKRLADVERRLADNTVVQEAQAALDAAEQATENMSKELRQSEGEVKDQQQKTKENQDALYGGKVRNPKELQELQMEAEALARHVSSLEDAELEKMMALEALQTALKQAQENMEVVKAQRSAELRALGGEQETLRAEEVRLSSERETTLSGIDKDALATYENLRSKGGLAVAKVNDKTCSACGAELSASLAQSARSPSELVRCASCRRILYAG